MSENDILEEYLPKIADALEDIAHQLDEIRMELASMGESETIEE